VLYFFGPVLLGGLFSTMGGTASGRITLFSPGGGFIAELVGRLACGSTKEFALVECACGRSWRLARRDDAFGRQKAARDAGLDVVEISPNAVPPVWKLVDYGKFSTSE